MKFYYTPIYGCRLLLAILFFLSGKVWSQQEYSLTGSVTDTTGLAIPGVHVQRLGTSTGSTTDFEGKFSIMVSATDSLKLTYLGFKTRVLPVNNRTHIKVQLYPNEETLQEVVINAGYYTTTERERTGSIAKVTAKEIELQPVGNPLQALQGRMAGVQVIQGNGVRGLATSIQIRGQNSLRTDGNLPLYIVDGVPINSSPVRTSGLLTNVPGLDPLNTLNLANVESIEILKDADATAIYGSRGANGVVLITTKKGQNKEGELQVETRLYKGVAEASHQMDLLNTNQYLAMRRAAFANDGVEPSLQNAPDLILWDQNRYTDWQEVLFGGVAEITSLDFSLSSGNQYTSFLIGGGYQEEGTVFPGDFGYQKATANINLNHRSEDEKFKLNFSANYGIDKNKLFSGQLVNLALSLPPNAPKLYDDLGNLNWEEATWTNPLSHLQNTQKVEANNLLANMSLEYQIAKGFHAKANLGYTFLTSEELIKSPKKAYNPIYWEFLDASSTHSDVKRSSWIVEPQLLYTTKLKKFNIQALLGLTFQNSSDKSLISFGQGYSHENLIGNLGAADQVLVEANDKIDYRYTAGFGRFGINWNKKYYLNLTGRRDGSSRFGPDKRFANFGAVGAAWIFTEEKWIKEQLPWLNYGKLRGSYGTTGSDQIPDYGYLDTYQPTPGPGGLYATKLTNPDYSWEVNRKLEFSLEWGMLKNRLQGELSWHYNRSSNQLVGLPLPATTGFASVQANLPAEVQNTGWEFSLNAKPIKSTYLQWQLGFNFTLPENKLVAFEAIEQTAFKDIYQVGKPLDIAFLYHYEGINPDTGFYEVTDVNADGVYNSEDRVVVKNLGREYYGGIQNSFTYKDFNLQFLLEFVKQDNYTYFSQASTPGFRANQPSAILPAWQNVGDQSQTQAFTQDIPGFMKHYYATQSEIAIADASFFRLKTMSLSYNLPQSLVNRLKLKHLRLFAHGQNLLTFTDYLGLDPQGGTVLPPLRTITGGIEIKF